MNIEDFVKRIEEEFEEITPGTLTPDGNFRDMFEWNSMNALVLMALISTEYEANITADELRNCNTIRDIYNIVLAQQPS